MLQKGAAMAIKQVDKAATTEEQAPPDYAGMGAESLVSQTDLIDKPEVAISISQEGKEYILCTLGNFAVITGKAKSRKSFFAHTLIAHSLCIINHSDKIHLKHCLPENKRTIIVFDTEMGKYHVSNAQRRILRLAGLQTSDNLVVHRLRKYDAALRLGFIEYLINNTPNIGIILIDGLRDLITSINDEEQASMITTKLMKWSEELNVCIICVLHQNKSDLMVRGVVGTEAQNKAEAVFSVTKSTENKDVSIVKPEYLREIEPEPFAFSIDENGLPYLLQDWLPGKEAVATKKKALLPGEIARETHIGILEKALKINKSPKYSELLFSLKNEVESWYTYPIGEAKIKSYISYYVDNELLSKKGKTPHVYYHLTTAALEPVD
jgi:hypothetical protein